MDYTLHKTAGVIYNIEETQFLESKKGNAYQKRYFFLEVPSMASLSQKTEIYKIGMFGDGCDDIEGFDLGNWVEVTIREKGRFWKKENGEEIHFQNKDLITIQKRDNPFEKKEESPKPEDLSMATFEDTKKRVKEFVKDPIAPNDEDDGLPF